MTSHEFEKALATRPIELKRALSQAEIVKLQEIQTLLDDQIDAWHRANSVLQLHEFLNMSLEEYNLFVEDPSTYFDNRIKKELAKS